MPRAQAAADPDAPAGAQRAGLPLEQDRARDGLQAHRGRAEKLALPRRPQPIAKADRRVKFVDGIEVVARSAAPQANAA